MFEVGQVIDGKYRITRPLGQGGMGAVFEALHLKIGRRVALKVTLTDMIRRHPDVVLRFQREARATGLIETSHIVQTLDTGVDTSTGLPYIVMELLSGEDLAGLIDNQGPLPPHLVLRITAQALLGLIKAHEAGVIHRDIKSANLFLAKKDAGEVVIKLLDFGIAKMTTDSLSSELGGLTRTGALLGSLEYVSPEQAMGSRNIDHRSDIWSLGTVMYEALCGHTPHQDLGTLGRVLIGICQSPVKSIQECAPWVPKEIAAIVHKALRIDVLDRFQTAQAMFDAVSRLLPDGWSVHERMIQPLTPEQMTKQEPLLPITGAMPLGAGPPPLPDGLSAKAFTAPSYPPPKRPSASEYQASPSPVAPRESGTRLGSTQMSRVSSQSRMAIEPPQVTPEPEPIKKDIFARLEELYSAAGRWDSLLELYIDRAKTRTEPRQRAELLCKAAQLYEERFKDKPKALDSLLKAFYSDYSHPETAVALGRLGEKLGRWKEILQTAEKWFDKETSPQRQANLGIQLAKWYVQREPPQYANRFLLKVLQLASENPAALRQVAEVYVQMDEWEDAQRVLTQALDVTTEELQKAEICYALGDLMECYAGDTRRARLWYMKAIQANPQHEEAAEGLRHLREK